MKIGEIKNVNISNVTITGPYPESYQATMAQNAYDYMKENLTICPNYYPFIITGQPDSIIKNVSLSNVQFVAPGGGTEEDRDLEVKLIRNDYPIADLMADKFPVYGLYAKHVDNLKLYNVEFMTEKEDKRDDIHLEDVSRYKNL